MSGPVYSSIQSSDGEHRLVVTTWLPEEKPRAVLQIVHGMREHVGRYDEFAQMLSNQGYVVCGHDHIGHGRTALEYGIYGFFGETKGAKTLVDDSNLITKQLSVQYPDTPLFLLGHSMGSFIARLQVLSTSSLLNGFICMGTAGEAQESSLFRVFTAMIAKTKGMQTSSSFMNQSIEMAFGSTLKKGEDKEAWISYNKANVEAFKNDPFTRFYFTNKGYCDLLDLQIASNRDEWYQKLDRLLPIILLSGKDDPVGKMSKDIPKIYNKLVNLSNMNDVSFILYPDMRHEILHENENEVVYKDIINWMETRMIG